MINVTTDSMPAEWVQKDQGFGTDELPSNIPSPDPFMLGSFARDGRGPFPGRSPQERPGFNALDRNGDGVITQREFERAQEPPLRTTDVDTNGDGTLSLQELDDVDGKPQNSASDQFAFLDVDGDGTVTLEEGEVDFARGQQTAVDADSDGSLSFTELGEALDTDGDGTISTQEIFALDTDGDGVISNPELLSFLMNGRGPVIEKVIAGDIPDQPIFTPYLKTPDEMTTAETPTVETPVAEQNDFGMFQPVVLGAFDTDGDGSISAAELTAVFDTDGDGVVSNAELEPLDTDSDGVVTDAEVVDRAVNLAFSEKTVPFMEKIGSNDNGTWSQEDGSEEDGSEGEWVETVAFDTGTE